MLLAGASEVLLVGASEVLQASVAEETAESEEKYEVLKGEICQLVETAHQSPRWVEGSWTRYQQCLLQQGKED